MGEPIAVIGSACRFAGDSNTPSQLWELLCKPKDVATSVPASRFGAEGFYHEKSAYHGHSNVEGMKSYFLSQEAVERRFDAGFFGINPAEAKVLDPQLRLLLETTYEALEAGGQTMEGLQGSDTGCYVGLMMGEYEQLMMRDPETIGKYHIMGTARSLMSNRLSYFFDWHGPSMTLDTACSSSLVAVHQAVQQLRSGQSRVAVAAGANLIVDPITHISESKLQMLSPDGRGRMWDARANGYARGEGVAAVVLKRLSDALADGDHVECVVREIGVNQDGKTRGLTLPSAAAQAALIRDTYRRAGLDARCAAHRPQYFEAHGTGTPAGDPIEAEAIYTAFFAAGADDAHDDDNDDDIDDASLWVGSIKTVCGHTEGTAGIAGLLKASLALQHAVVPPNLLFTRLNPRIQPFSTRLRVPLQPQPWPAPAPGQPRRAGVNNFGFGGTNCFALLEAYDGGRPRPATPCTATPPCTPFVFSAASEHALARQLAAFAAYVEANEHTLSLPSLAYTLHARRSRLLYATAVGAADARDLHTKLRHKLQSGAPIGVRDASSSSSSTTTTTASIVGVFTGQGAQWPRMGAELLQHSPAAAATFASLETHLATRLPPADRPQWSLRDELLQAAASSRIAEAQLSQPLCTAVQIVLVDLLRAAGITFAAVLGHSSGEIAAAYAANVLSAHDAIAIAYYRGLHSSLACSPHGHKGAMLAAGITPEDALDLLDSPVFQGRATIAAYNASSSLTIAGDADAIDELRIILEDEDKFARLLKVDKAYHSHHMAPCAGPYGDSLRALDIKISPPTCTWISSVSGNQIQDVDLHALGHDYWVQNAVNPVLFMQALQKTCASMASSEHLYVEVGPHPALQSPAAETIRATAGREIPYTGLLKRGAPDVVSVAEGIGYIWTHLSRFPLNLHALDRFMCPDTAAPQLVHGLPTYSWDHDIEYWHESRYTKATMSRSKPHELLGHMTSDSVPEKELRWRQILSPAEIPWLSGHRLQNQTVFPAAGYVALAIEACRELLALSPELGPAKLIKIQHIDIHKALTFDSDDSTVEAIFSLSDIAQEKDTLSANFRYFAASSGTGHTSDNESSLRILVSGCVAINLGEPASDALPARGPTPDSLLPIQAEELYESLLQLEYEYTGQFRALSGLQRKLGTVTGLVAGPTKDLKSTLLVHPGMLDAAFQAILFARTAPFDGSLWSMHVPKTIDCITVNLCISETQLALSGQQLPFNAYLQDRLAKSFKGDVDIYPPQGHSASVVLDSEKPVHALIQVEGLDCIPFSPPTAQDDKEIMSVMSWDRAYPDAASAAYDLSPIPDPHELELAHFLERASLYYLNQIRRSIPTDHPCRNEGQPLSRLFSYAEHIESRIANGQLPFWKHEWFNDTRETIAMASKPFEHVVDYKLLTRIGENLHDIVTGKTTAIELTMKDDLLNDFYPVALGMAHHTKYLARTVKQITYRFPHMNILEVGAGTGGATKVVLDMLGDSFSSYTFTDISAGFFLRAQEYFSSFSSSPRMVYKVLDISKNPQQQGFTEHSYDLIIASQVLHATPLMKQSLLNARRLLKPGGFLVVNEGVNNDTARLGTIFGAFPGWWLGAENDGRPLGPNLALADWDKLLRDTGFSGCDSQVPIVDALLTPNTVFVSQAVDPRVSFTRNPLSLSPQALSSLNTVNEEAPMDELIIIGGESSSLAPNIAHEVKLLLKDFFGKSTHIRTLADVAADNVPVSSRATILALSDLDEPMFRQLTEAKLQAMKRILHEAVSVLWVTQGRRAQDPFANMTVGLVRAALLEIPTLEFQFLDFEDASTIKARTIAEFLLRFKLESTWVTRRGSSKNGSNPLLTTVEREYVIDKDGQLLIPRILPSKEMNDRYNSARRPIYKSVVIDDHSADHHKNHDQRVRLGIQNNEYYLEEAGQEADSEILQPTHSLLLACRIRGLGFGHMSLTRDESYTQVTLSNQLSSSIRPAHDLCQALSSREETLLKDSATKARFLRLVKLNILASDTVSHLSSSDHVVLLEPNLAFANAVKREATIKNIGVTIISSKLEKGRCNFLGWLKIHSEAPGRSVCKILPKKASFFLACDGSQPSDMTDMAARIIPHLPSECNVTYFTQLHATKACIEPLETAGPTHDVHNQLRTAVQHALKDLVQLSVEGTVIRVDNISKAAPGLDPKQNLTHDQTVIEWEGVKSVPVKLRPVDDQSLFSDSKTYWLAGLTGSLGLSLCEWMISRGAKYIIMTSRNPNISREWRDRVALLGGIVKIYSNDLTDLVQTRALYEDICSAMPPIGGIVSAAMVLVDTTLENMTLEEMQKVCHPKVQGTTNLDKLFFDVDLDFFVAFSSIVAVTGNPGQSNYAAANMFMTSLMEQRRKRGLAASVMHIAPILGVGYVTEKSDRTKTNFPRTSGYSLTAEQDFHQVFAEAVVAGRTGTESTGNAEIVMGLHKVNSNPEKLPYWFDNPTATHFISNNDAMDVSKASTEKASVKSQLSAAKNSAQVAQIMTDAMKPFICSLFQVQGGADLSDSQFLDLTLDRIGLDSLLAVEIRSWLLKTVNANLPVMKILSGLSIRQLISHAVDSVPSTLIPNVSSSNSNDSAQPNGPFALQSEAINSIESSDKSVVSDYSSSNSTDTKRSSSPASSNADISIMSASKDLDHAISTTKTTEIAVERWTELSFSQTMFWFVLKFLNGMAGLNHTGLFRMTGPLRIADLKRAVMQLGNRHEVLRTCFKAFDNRPQQGIMESSRLRLEHRRISSEEQVMSVFEELQSYAYDVELGECLRIILLELSPEVYFLLQGTHSLVLDGISGSILMQDLLRLYENDMSIAESTDIYQYSTFAQAQRKAVEDGRLEKSLRFWKEQLAPCPPPLPVLRISAATTHPVYTKYQNQRVDLTVDSATKSRIWEICRRCRIRPFHFFLTAFRALLSRYADAEEVCIGIADANRSHEGAMEGLGPYINLLPLRFPNSASQKFEAELQETKSKADSALAHSDVPFQLLLNELRVSRSATQSPIFQTFFDYRQGMRKRESWGECELELLSFQASELPYDLSFDIIDDSGTNTCHLMLIARGDIYSKENVETLLESLKKMIHAFIDTPNSAFVDPDIFDAGKIEKALQFGRGDAVRSQWPYESIVGRIQDMANSMPNEVALKMPFGGKSMTYKEMLNKSQSICAALCAMGCTAGSKVAVYQEPTPDWLCSVLGVLGARAVCVPFDAGTLVKRLKDMAEDSKVAFILVDSKVEDQAVQLLETNSVCKIINVEHVTDDYPTAGPLMLPSAEDPAMVLYTSGSTGVPKGIVLKHIGFRNWAEFVPPLFRFGERDVVLQQSSSGFDMAYLQAFFALCYGGTVCIVPREMRVDARAIADIIASESVTVTCGVPSEYTNWLQYGSSQSLSRATHWRTAMCGGEPGTNIVLELQATLGPQPPPRFFHMYGPTEITFITTAMELFYGSAEKTPAVGGPFSNYSVYVLDEQLRPVPAGVQGEIYVGGAGVAAGYLANEQMTAEKFVSDPHASPSFKSLGWTTMHRTGDNGRWRQDGGLLIEGRRSGDTQHKLRGLRIDLQEVENVMLKESNGMLSDAVVSVVRTSPSSPEFLVAHVKFYPQHRPSEADEQRVLNQLSSNLELPQYMWPAVTVAVEELPMMSSGKLDRRAVASLPLPDLPQFHDDVDSTDLTETEFRLKELWQDVISKDVTKLHRIHAHADFFHAGGTSMLLLRLQSRIQQHFGLEIPFAQMFEASTLGSMAKRIEKGRESNVEQFDWDAETAISEPTVSALTDATSPIVSPPKVVVLTGATGLVGQGLLQALIEDSNVDKIHCIAVRNVSARIASLPLFKHSKVILHEGELSLPLVGLDDAEAKAIFQEADCIIHNGADTSHFKTYQSLRATNTISTQEIVSMCLLAKKKIPISYISTASILQYSGLDEFGEESAAQYPPPPDAFDGYSASKWASERYLERLHEQNNRTWPISIHRLTSVQRRVRSTEPNSDTSPSPSSNAALEVVGNLLQYCKLANAVPLSSNLRGSMNLTWLDDVVTSVMRAIHTPSYNGSGESPLRYLHDHGETDISFSNIKAYVDAETGGDAQVLPLEAWVKRAAELGLDPMLVAYFDMVARMPLVVWPRLVKN